ncbi:MAG: hypothetical protein HY260_20930 [Chloroflexi bacterium]|nr:hypothetical protein [Chloroflexota bacterium]
MKTWKIVAISAVVVLALAALGAGFAFAQAPTPPAPGNGWGGMMGGNGGSAMMGGFSNQNGTPAPGYGVMGGWGQNGGNYQWMNNMHQWMFTTGGMHTLVWGGLADALKLTQDELNAQLASGKTLAQIAEAKGVTQEQLAAALETSVKAGLDKAVADGVLTREQADGMLNQMGGNWGWMIGHMGAGGGAGFGPGGCHGTFVSQNNQ